MPTPALEPKIALRLQTEHNIWLATVRPNGTPHLVPIWFVWVAARLYVCTASDSVKARNLLANPRVAAALEDGGKPLVIEGQAHALGTVPPPVVEAFQRKYDWDVTTDREYNLVIEIKPTRIRT